MKYTVHYWRHDLSSIVGHNQAEVINEMDVLAIMKSEKVNIMIHNVVAVGDKPAAAYCYIDDLNHRFQTR